MSASRIVASNMSTSFRRASNYVENRITASKNMRHVRQLNPLRKMCSVRRKVNSRRCFSETKPHSSKPISVWLTGKRGFASLFCSNCNLRVSWYCIQRWRPDRFTKGVHAVIHLWIRAWISSNWISMTKKLHSLWAGSIAPCYSIPSTFLWLIALGIGPLQYCRCVHGCDSGQPAIRCCTVLIRTSWPHETERCLNIILRTARWRSMQKESSFNVSFEAFVISCGKKKCIAFGSLSGALFSLPATGCSSPMQQIFLAVSVRLTRSVRLITADATTCPFWIGHIRISKLAMRSWNILFGFFCANSFVQIC